MNHGGKAMRKREAETPRAWAIEMAQRARAKLRWREKPTKSASDTLETGRDSSLTEMRKRTEVCTFEVV
jgi:hypothetical protein